MMKISIREMWFWRYIKQMTSHDQQMLLCKPILVAVGENQQLNLFWHCSRTSWIYGWVKMGAEAPLRQRCCWVAPLVKSPTSESFICSRIPTALRCGSLDMRGTIHTPCHLSFIPCWMKQVLKLVNLLHNVSCSLKGTGKILGTANQREAI